MNQRGFAIIVLAVAVASLAWALTEDEPPTFDPELDLLSLHYDHAPDKDDGHSAAADRTMLESLHGREWIGQHVLAVSGAYGKNAKRFNAKSDTVMDATWNPCGGWLAGHTEREAVVATMVERWASTLSNGGDVWVKEGGQSDITADVVKLLKLKMPDLDTPTRIHVVQHSTWNEKKTTDAALAYTKQETRYVRIRDANAYLNVKRGDAAFEKAARTHPIFGDAWRAAFDYYPPRHRLDFSDTGELMHILGLGKISIDEFRQRFLAKPAATQPAATQPAATQAASESGGAAAAE